MLNRSELFIITLLNFLQQSFDITKKMQLTFILLTLFLKFFLVRITIFYKISRIHQKKFIFNNNFLLYKINTSWQLTNIQKIAYKDDKKGGVDRSSTVIAKDPEGKKSTQLLYFINKMLKISLTNSFSKLLSRLHNLVVCGKCSSRLTKF